VRIEQSTSLATYLAGTYQHNLYLAWIPMCSITSTHPKNDESPRLRPVSILHPPSSLRDPTSAAVTATATAPNSQERTRATAATSRIFVSLSLQPDVHHSPVHYSPAQSFIHRSTYLPIHHLVPTILYSTTPQQTSKGEQLHTARTTTRVR